MNRITRRILPLVVALGATALGTASVFAQTASDSQPMPLTRQQVTAELQRARASGEIDNAAAELNGGSYGRAKSWNSAAMRPTRTEVVAELQRARSSGELDRTSSELEGAPVIASTSHFSRGEVVAELKRARASGELDRTAMELEGSPISYRR